MKNGDLELGEVDLIQRRVQSLLDFVESEVNHPSQVSPPYICMAPRILRDLSPSSFEPQVVSIGPLHKENEHLKAFERQKASYLIKLVSRVVGSSREEILKTCMQKVCASMNKVKACYVWPNTSYTDDEISQMMVIDACFILEFLHNVHLRSRLTLDLVINDLFLLENQIPFFILNDIFECTILKFNPRASLIRMTLPLLSCLDIFRSHYLEIDNISIDNTHHILSLLHQCYKPQNIIVRTLKLGSTKRIPSVLDLDTAGVNFKPNHDSTCTMGMQVKLHRFPCVFGLPCKATLRMPKLYVDDSTELVLRNLIAYEQLGLTTCNHMTSYAYFIDALVNTEEDVTKLVDSGVLINYIGSNKEVTIMINNICKRVHFVEFFYTEQSNTLNEYYNSYLLKNIASLRRTYFSSPWNLIALLAGIILFALTMVQTIFTVKSAGSSK